MEGSKVYLGDGCSDLNAVCTSRVAVRRCPRTGVASKVRGEVCSRPGFGVRG